MIAKVYNIQTDSCKHSNNIAIRETTPTKANSYCSSRKFSQKLNIGHSKLKIENMIII